MPSRTEILKEATASITGSREQTYGSPEDSFSTIATFWTTYLNTEIKSEDVAAMMALLKIARIRGKHDYLDSWVDLAGYAACGGEVAIREEKKKEPDMDQGDGVSPTSPCGTTWRMEQ